MLTYIVFSDKIYLLKRDSTRLAKMGVMPILSFGGVLWEFYLKQQTQNILNKKIKKDRQVVTAQINAAKLTNYEDWKCTPDISNLYLYKWGYFMIQSKFNIITKNNENFIIYNTLNNSIIELNPVEYKKAMKNIKENKMSEVILSLKDQGMVIDEDDELDIIKYNYKCMQFDNLNLSLTICPTMDCIFRCPYCFESRKHGKMTEENQKRLVEFVRNNIKTCKSMDVLWFGGEPLMAFDVIENLSKEFLKICEEYNIPYTAYIISNAYLIDDEIAKKFVEYKISGIQVTIDGPKEIHDTRRVLEGNVGTYEKICENIKILQNYDIKITIRINIDKTNENKISALFKDFDQKGLNKVRFDFGHILDYTENCKAISCTCLTKQNFSKVILNYEKELKKYNFEQNKIKHIPESISIYCDAEKKFAYNIDHELNLYKCWNEIGDATKVIGKLGEDERTDQQRYNERRYILWDPFASKTCRKCKYLPLCLGGCPFMGLKLRKNQCDKWKFVIDSIVKEYVNQDELWIN